MSSAIRESKYRTSFSRTKFFFDCDEIFDFKSLNVFCAVLSSQYWYLSQPLWEPTSRQVILNLQIALVRTDAQVQSSDGISLALPRTPPIVGLT